MSHYFNVEIGLADLRIEVVEHELNQGALAGFDSSVTGYAAGGYAKPAGNEGLMMTDDLEPRHSASECDEFHDLVRDFGGPRPEIIVLCGSTRFGEAFAEANLRLTVDGAIVLSIGCDLRSDHELWADLTENQIGELKESLDVLHKRKIDLADRVLVLNVGGYIGSSTRSEIEYAEKIGRPVDYLTEAGTAP